MDGCGVQLHHLVTCVNAKRQADCVPGFMEPGLHIITGILLHNIGSCFSFTSALLVVVSILQWIILGAWGVLRGKCETLMRLRCIVYEEEGNKGTYIASNYPKVSSSVYNQYHLDQIEAH